MVESFLNKHAFLLRRIHSLLGIVPIGVFLLFHLTTNGSVVWGYVNASKYVGVHPGAATFQHEVNFIHSLPALILMEVFVLWVPIAIHAILGAYYAAKGRSTLHRYQSQNNVRYALQRITAWIGLVFIVYHVATLRWGWDFLIPGGTKWDAEHSASTLAAIFRGAYVEAGQPAVEGTGLTALGVVIIAGYLIGVSSLVFHLANGLWTAAITWGLTISEKAQRNWGYVCAALGVGLMALGWSAVFGFATLDYEEARQAELRIMELESGTDEEGEQDLVEQEMPALVVPTGAAADDPQEVK